MGERLKDDRVGIAEVDEYVTSMLLSLADMADRSGSDYGHALRSIAKAPPPPDAPQRGRDARV